ncbi:MraY family glycosyltransferase [Allosphingosinicella vermicomposti]|uniref:MraY family glycosyltransferase n=1 Tax=Allosphingosinicella vermicomposti TaxID=614671 RepID=UPI001AED0B73|nr:glycosyltransferase family 4 protein [Allosphingosinicella vermicomposti]
MPYNPENIYFYLMRRHRLCDVRGGYYKHESFNSMGSNSLVLVLAFAAFLSAAALTGKIRTYALSAGIVDEVNARASHSIPTPRGGGAAIVIVATVGFLTSTLWLGFPIRLACGLIGGGIAVAVIGWLDDHGHVAPKIRLATHIGAASWAAIWIGPLPLDFLPFWNSALEFWEWPVTVLFIAWMVNLYNFMDGIDGIAGSEAVSVGLGGTIFLGIAGAAVGMLAPSLLLIAAALGFLIWNWPPAKIFMGDAGSGFLGFTLATLSVIAGNVAPELAAAWIILLGIFVVDTGVTLARRMLRGERLHEAHRTHAYQRLARHYGAHLPITSATIAITWLWLFPIAFLVAITWLSPISGVFIAYFPLVAIALFAGAGNLDK